MKITDKAYAKINLSINIVGKRKNGYHDLDMVLQTVDLYDSIEIEKIQDDKIILECTDKSLPTDIKNDAYKAAILMKKAFEIKSGYKIFIEKNIPIEAGLGGGSSDAASVINSIVKLENIDTSVEKLSEIALEIGAEMPYSIRGGLKRVKGIGEIIENIDYKHDYFFTIIKPNFSVKTADIFKEIDINKIEKDKYNNDELILGIKNKDKTLFLNSMNNDLELVTTKIHPEIIEIKDKLIELGALKSLMSGSGSSTFGVFDSLDTAINAEKYFQLQDMRAFAVSPI